VVMLGRTDAGLPQIRLREPGPTASPESKAAIERRMRTASSSFFWPMRSLSAPRRKAMHALYVFYCEVSSIADSEASRTLKLALLADWHAQIALLHAGRPERPVTRALRDAIGRFDLRSEDFLVIIEGMKTVSSTDLRAPSYEQLDHYCEHTAVAVNCIALRILGAAQPDGERLAAALGRGMQLTVILRDLARGRRLATPLPATRTAPCTGHLRHDAKLRIGAAGAAAGLRRACRATSRRWSSKRDSELENEADARKPPLRTIGTSPWI
jgi:squalene/phytoene synthase